jgi:hypothetical protein
MTEPPNKPAAPNAGIASQLTAGRRWPGVGESERYAKAYITLPGGLPRAEEV